MSEHIDVEIDRDRVEAEAERDRARMRSRRAWVARVWGIGFLGFLLAMVGARAWTRLVGDETLPWSWLSLALLVAFAGVTATVQTAVLWRFAKRSVEERCRYIQRTWVKLTSTGWLKRAVVYSAAASIGIGFLPGTILSFALLPHELPIGGQPGMVASFIAATFLWVLPAALVLRYFMIRQLKGYIRRPGWAEEVLIR